MAKKRVADDADKIELAVPLPLPGDLGSEDYWTEEIRQAEARRKKILPLWRANIDRYRGARPKLTGIGKDEVIAVNVDFYNTEQKKAQLFFQSPEIQALALQPGLDQAAIIVQHVVNYYLGPHEIDAKRLVDDCLFDVLCPSGFAAIKIGYEDRKTQVFLPDPPDPMTGQPPVDPLTGQPAGQMVPKTLWHRYYMEHLPPEKVLLPASFTSGRYENAPWIGFQFEPDVEDVKKRGVGKDTLSEITDNDTLVPAEDKEFARVGTVGYEIWYKASLYDPEVKNPELYRRLVMVQRTKKRSSVIIHEDSPYQQFDPETGALTQGMRGNPIHLLSLRSVTDTAYPPSDCAISRPQVDELSLGRSQMVIQRRRNLPIRGFDKNRVDKQTVDKIVAGEVQALIGFDGPITDDMIRQISAAAFPRENFTFNDYVQQDVDKCWALGANQQGVTEDTARTATELHLMQGATDTRMAAERERVLAWYVKAVDKLFALLQIFANEEQIVPIVGKDGMQQLATWDKTTIQGRFAFSVKANSSVRVDASEERDLYLRAYNLLANDPNVNRLELDKLVLPKLNLDPARLLQQPPPPPPEKPKINFSFRGEDLRDPVVLDILQQSGIKISPQAIVEAAQMALRGDLAQPATQQQGAPNAQTHGGPAQPPQQVSAQEGARTGRPNGRPPM